MALKPRKPERAAKNRDATEIEQEPGAWERFERAVDVALKTPPMHKEAPKPKHKSKDKPIRKDKEG